MPPLNCQDFAVQGLAAEMANVIGINGNEQVVLTSLGVQPNIIPPSSTPMGFWTTICNLVMGGAVTGNYRLERLLGAAYDVFPGNPHFELYSAFSPRRYNSDKPPRCPNEPEPAEEQAEQEDASPETSSQPETTSEPGGPVIMVTGHADVGEAIESLRQLANEMDLPGPVEPGFVSAGCLLFNLPNMDAAQAARLAQTFSDRMGKAGANVETTTAANEFRDYLIRRIFVSGPDQARFELENVPASTRVRDIAASVIGQYDPKMWGLNREGKPRAAVVDRQGEDGSPDRLNPDTSLHENNIRENDILHVSPESTAGVHPNLREEALVRVRLQVVAFAESHPGFAVSANATRAPTEYEFSFRTESFAPPAGPGLTPPRVNRHRVYLFLPADFPMQAPEAYWQTPIFHPNIHRETGKVCLGALADQYRPGLDFGELCQMLVDMAAYRNYAVSECYDKQAQEWAITVEGQLEIEKIGGESVLRKLAREHLSVHRPLEIKRMKT